MSHTLPAAPALRTVYLTKPDSAWDWQDLRDYVFTEIQKRQGSVQRDVRKEAGIFKSFMSRWGSDAVRIAKTAFDFYDGQWQGGPITMTRFCKGSDPYFAEVIAARWS